MFFCVDALEAAKTFRGNPNWHIHLVADKFFVSRIVFKSVEAFYIPRKVNLVARLLAKVGITGGVCFVFFFFFIFW